MQKSSIGAIVLAGVFAVSGAATLRAATMTLEGTVGDAECGVKHLMKESEA